MTWEHDKRWSDRFIPEITMHLGRTLITEPPIIEDQERNSDLMVLKMDMVRVACRIRKYQYRARYGDQFTVRAGRPGGTKTELTKVMEGWGTHIFYGFCDQYEKKLDQWFIGDLNVFRGWFNRQLVGLDRGQIPGLVKSNWDNSSSFASFQLSQLPTEFLLDSHGLNSINNGRFAVNSVQNLVGPNLNTGGYQ